MLREADAAMYRAKERGRGRAEMFDEAMRRDAFERLRTESDLRRALERDEFRVLYQPIFDIASCARSPSRRSCAGSTRPAASSARRVHPAGRGDGTHRAAGPLGARARRRRGGGLGRPLPRVPLRVAVNLSAQQLARPEFLHEVRAALEASDLPPERLGLEITETILIKESGSPRSTLEALREIGVRVLIDDFGTGYSSLARLKRFPLDDIKIDRSFVAGSTRGRGHGVVAAIVTSPARSASGRGRGRRGPGPARAPLELGCHAVQGYLFSGPLHGEAFATFLADEEPDAQAAVAAL